MTKNRSTQEDEEEHTLTRGTEGRIDETRRRIDIPVRLDIPPTGSITSRGSDATHHSWTITMLGNTMPRVGKARARLVAVPAAEVTIPDLIERRGRIDDRALLAVQDTLQCLEGLQTSPP